MEESMNRKGRPRNSNGAVFRRDGSSNWWIRYRDDEGRIRRESTRFKDQEEAEKLLRERLQARDHGALRALLQGNALTLNEWADWFLENRSRPPFRAMKPHLENLNALKFLRPAFGCMRLTEISSDAIEEYILRRLGSGRRIHTKKGLRSRGKLKPATVHKEYRILRRMLNVAVKRNVFW
jgi:hypothetical protein